VHRDDTGWTAGSPCTQLDNGTKLDRVRHAYWAVVLYPEAGEATAVFHSARSARPGTGVGFDPEDAARVALRRARSHARRYCAANRTNRFVTLTFGAEKCWDPVELRPLVRGFFRRLRADLGVAFPYIWVSELHKKGDYHVHFAVNRFVHRSTIEAAWGRGFIKIRLHGDLPSGRTALLEARRTAGYMAKYMTKSSTEVAAGLHRYEVAQGFQPRRETVAGRSLAEVVGWASQRMGHWPDFEKASSEWERYAGPPALFMSWT
jgi:hypothetical protein